MTDLPLDTEGRLLFERIAALSDAMMFITDMETNSLWVNDRLVKLTGYTLDDYRFQRFENPFIPAEDIARVTEFLGEFLASGEVLSGEVRNRFVDRWGGTLHVVTRVAQVTWRGEPALLYSTRLEDPEARQSEEVEQRYRSLVEAAPDAIVRLRADLTVHYSNRCFQRLVGRDPVALNRLSFPALVPESHRSAVHDALTSGASRVTLSAPVRSAGGPVVWLDGTFVRIAAGADAGKLQAILRDTTAQRRIDAALAQAHKSETLARMASGIAHDLNNILTGIIGSASLAEADVDHTTSVGSALSDIRLAATRAGELSSAMLAYAGQGNAARVTVDLAVLVSEMKPLLGSAVGKTVSIEVSVPDHALPVLADEIQLRQVVMNLITNAADASRPSGGGAVTVTAEARHLDAEFALSEHLFGAPPPTGRRVASVVVRDEGVGMSPETLARIFDPFFTTREEGRGLGLAAVLGILRRHEGCVRVDSVKGEGTRMEVVLPLSAEEPRRTSRRLARDQRSLTGTALVVDDEAPIRSLVGRILQKRGMTVLSAATGEEGLALLEDAGAAVEVVILDQVMPGMGGDRALACIRQDRPTLPVIRTSGNTADPALQAPDAHTWFLGKPYGIQQLVDIVRQALGD